MPKIPILSPRLAIILLLAATPRAEGQASVLYYADSRLNNTLSIFFQGNDLPGGLAAWGFVDLDSPQHDERRQADLDGFFAEARLTRAVGRGLSVQVEYNDATGQGNDLLRLGLVYKVPTPSAVILLRGFPLESDGDGWQAGVVWRWRPLPQPFFFEGFADYNVAETANRWVIEPQLRYMLTSEIGVVLEGRRNEFIGGNRDNTGVAVGIALML